MSEEKFIEVRPGEYMKAVPEEKAKKPEMITAFAYENALMHKDFDNERANRTTLYVCVFAIVFALTFVVAYTIRMNSFVNLIKEMNAAIVQLASAKGVISP